MAAGIPTLALYTDLPQAGGTQVAYLKDWANASATLAEDSDDRLTLTVARSDAAASSLTVGACIQAQYGDDTIEEWVVEGVDIQWPEDQVVVTCLGARAWLAEQYLIYDGTSTDEGTSVVEFEGSPETILDTLVARSDWPSWVIVGTVTPTRYMALTATNDNALSFILALVSAANTGRLGDESPYLFRFRRVSATQYAIDIVNTPTAATAHLLPGKNLDGLSVRSDRSQQRTALVPVGTDNKLTGRAWWRIRYINPGPTGQKDVGVSSIDSYEKPILYDGQWVGKYLMDWAGTTYEILDSEVDSGTYGKVFISDSSFPSGAGWCRFVEDSGGTTPVVLHETDVTPPRLGFASDPALAQRINFAYDPHFREWSGSSFTGWAVSTGTWAQDTTYWETGGGSLKLTTGTNASPHLILGSAGGTWPGELRAGDWVFGMRIYGKNVTNSLCRMRVKDNTTTKGTITSGAGWNASTSEWATITGSFSLTGSSASTYNIELDGAGSGSPVYWDRVWIYRLADDGDNSLSGSEAARLVSAAQHNSYSADQDPGTAPVTHTAKITDLYRSDPSGYPLEAIDPYTTVRLENPDVSIDTTLRVARVVRQLDEPKNTTLELGTPRRRLTSQL